MFCSAISRSAVALRLKGVSRPSTHVNQYLPRLTYRQTLGGLVLLTVLLASGLSPMQSDTWWQLRAGKDMWASGRVMLWDSYSHTANGAFWPNHEWLAEILYYAAYRLGGLPLVTLMAAALIAGGWLIAWSLTSGAPSRVFAWTAIALLPASLWWEPRPHAFSLLFQMIAVYLMSVRRYGWLPPLFLVWSNCHGGVLLGLVVLTAGLAPVAVRVPAARRAIVATWIACLATTLLTPLGWRFWVSIPESLGRISLYPLDEWRRTPLFDPHLAPFWLIAGVFSWAVLRAYARTRADAPSWNETTCACALVLLPAGILSIRNVGPFLMVAVPALTSLLDHRADNRAGSHERPALNLLVLSSAGLLVLAILIRSYALPAAKLKWQPVSAGALAAIAVCPGNLYNRYDEGGYLLWFAPARKVFIDGRQDPYAAALVLEHIQMETVGGDTDGVFSRYDIGCAYLPASSPTAAHLVQSGWATLFDGDEWLVLARQAKTSSAVFQPIP
jgi:hypothetical protein